MESSEASSRRPYDKRRQRHITELEGAGMLYEMQSNIRGIRFMEEAHERPATLRVVAFNGSARKNGNTSILLRYVLQELEKEGIATELIQMSGTTIHSCLACRKCSTRKDGRCSQADDTGNVYIEKMAHADGILLGSPTYVADVSPEIKALMDRACLVSKANGGMFRRKVGAAVVAVRRAGAIHAFDALNHFFLINEMVIPGSSYWNIGIGWELGEVENDAEGIRTMKVLGQNMAWLLQTVAEAKKEEAFAGK
jgi:multimeric flavodoxin WrbA